VATSSAFIRVARPGEWRGSVPPRGARRGVLPGWGARHPIDDPWCEADEAGARRSSHRSRPIRPSRRPETRRGWHPPPACGHVDRRPGRLRTITPMEFSGAGTATPGPSASPRRRRLGAARGRVLAVAAVLSVAGLVGAAWAAFARGTAWRDRADDRAARITDLEDELRTAEAELRVVETRVGELTEEVAAAQDQRSIAELTAEQAQELADLAGAVARDLASCVEGTSELVRIVRDVEAYDPATATNYVGGASPAGSSRRRGAGLAARCGGSCHGLKVTCSALGSASLAGRALAGRSSGKDRSRRPSPAPGPRRRAARPLPTRHRGGTRRC
jgi:hypothetical protein